jgi:16S rRNA (guanine527-N7)-methyltransferase
MDKFLQDIQNLTGYHLSSRQVNAFRLYELELLDWSSRFNLTAIRDSDGIRTKHFLDSLTCLVMMGNKPVNRLIDIGTGAGFPGIPIKIVLPDLKLTLVESVGKKANFCRHIIETLKLEQIQVIVGRAEEVGQDPAHREQYDWAVARAVAQLHTLTEYLLPLVKIGGAILAQKGESGPAEANAAERSARLMGGRLRQLRQVNLPGVAEDRFLVVFDKISATPPQYPRRVGLPSKTPLV